MKGRKVLKKIKDRLRNRRSDEWLWGVNSDTTPYVDLEDPVNAEILMKGSKDFEGLGEVVPEPTEALKEIFQDNPNVSIEI